MNKQKEFSCRGMPKTLPSRAKKESRLSRFKFAFMEKKFQPLSLRKFDSSGLQNTRKVLGGIGSYIPDGGATCQSGGGSTDHFTYTSDTEVYNGEGALYQKDYHGAVFYEAH